MTFSISKWRYLSRTRTNKQTKTRSPPNHPMRTRNPVPAPANLHHRQPRRIDRVIVIPVGHQREPSQEQLTQADQSRGGLELYSRETFDAEELGGGEGLGEDYLGVRCEYLMGEREEGEIGLRFRRCCRRGGFAV
mmetsp:Transcript_23072/g.41189  ORF Transcript_23072/g.41189 Transcript_23072/m.41189 type:complete len:135 (-) Transcript_23072:173-577(-)